MAEHAVQWTHPAPMWTELIGAGTPDGMEQASTAELAATRQEFQRPAILRFATDTFMEDFLSILETAPEKLGQLRASRETWRGPAADGPAAGLRPLPRFARPMEMRRLAAENASSGNGRNGAGRGGGLKALLNPPGPAEDVFGAVSPALKLYQPAHMRHYLVTACLVCQEPGLPDRMLNSSTREHTGFVVRRLLPLDPKSTAASGDPYPADEYALVKENGLTGWKKVRGGASQGPQDALILAQGEEQQSLFPVTFQQAEGRRRRLLAGVVPVGRREAYMGAALLSSLSGAALGGPAANPNYLKPGEHLLITQVIEPWKRLIETAARAAERLTPPALPFTKDEAMPDPPKTAFVRTTREQIQSAAWMVLLDFARLLRQFLPEVWKHILDSSSAAPNTPEAAVLNKLRGTKIDPLAWNLNELVAGSSYTTAKVLPSLDAALLAILSSADKIAFLESSTGQYHRDQNVADWPAFLFPLADPVQFTKGPLPPTTGELMKGKTDLDRRLEAVDHLLETLKNALPAAENTTESSPALPLAARPLLDPGEGWFVIRCVLERPECDPRLSPAVVSEATQPFQMAGFFDPDAPARPIRINLPIDTTPAGLRKFDKNTAFMMSDVLCGQVQRAKGLSLGDLIRSVLPWPLHKDLALPETGPCGEPGNTLGMICSISIPIITICALILLIIIVTILDAIFFWLPYFIMCFPLPKFLAKESK